MLIWIIICIISAIIMACIVYKHPQMMKIMNYVWIINCLWGGPLIIGLFYLVKKTKKTHNKIAWQSIVTSTLHCGSGCTLADLIMFVITNFIYMNFVTNVFLSTVLAFFTGILFQYIVQREMDHKTATKLLVKKAILSDFWSLLSWQVGMILIMYLGMYFHLDTLLINKIFIMQLAMVGGFICGLPTNYLLLKFGIKKAM